MTGDANDTPANRPNVYTVQHDLNGAKPLNTAVVLAVADTARLEPEEIHQTLYEAIDPDALDDIFRGDASSDGAVGQISFSLADYRVTVDNDGLITVWQDDDFQ